MLENQVISAIVTQQGAIYVAACPEFGTVEQGATEADAIANLRILNSVYNSIALPEINLRSVHFDIVNKATEIPPDFPPIEISAWRAVRLLENAGFNRVRGLMIMQKNSFDTTNTCIIPLHHRILKRTYPTKAEIRARISIKLKQNKKKTKWQVGLRD